MITLGIDASNIRAGGGLVHLKKSIEYFNPNSFGIAKIVIIGGSQLVYLDEKSWLVKSIQMDLDKSFLSQAYWKIFKRNKVFSKHCVDVIWAPGGTFYSSSIPYISMSQNMLVFQEKERNLYRYSLKWIRLKLLEFVQKKSLSNSIGNIYISKFAKEYIHNKHPLIETVTNKVIHLGATKAFKQNAKAQRNISEYSHSKPFELLYISILEPYKHHLELIEAVKLLRSNYPIRLRLIGANGLLEKEVLEKMKNTEEYILFEGKIDFLEIARYYKRTNAFVFPSSCENMPNILIEAMSAGLPISCSSLGPMPEFLKDAGVYFNPYNINEIKNSLEKLILDPQLRERNAILAHQYSNEYTWEDSANETLEFIQNSYKTYINEATATKSKFR
jgi:glycosyltransferase involved in cell wall biosynthesis